MKRAGFTMIELIFVIVILGILASVAVPKLVGVKENADEGIVKGFVGTLNRTVGPSKWSSAIMDGNGSVSTLSITTADTEFPSAFTNTTIDLSQCSASDANTSGTTPAAKTADDKYSIICRDGSSSSSPKFWYVDGPGTTAVNFPTSSKLKAP